jgi:hypothetical protein
LELLPRRNRPHWVKPALVCRKHSYLWHRDRGNSGASKRSFIWVKASPQITFFTVGSSEFGVISIHWPILV